MSAPYPPPHGQPQYGQQPYGYPGPYGQPVSKPTGWFIVNWLFFWPLAIYSLVSAWNNIDPAMYHGDIAGAQYQAARVRKFGIIGLCVGIVLFVVGIVADVLIFSSIVHSGCTYSQYQNSC